MRPEVDVRGAKRWEEASQLNPFITSQPFPLQTHNFLLYVQSLGQALFFNLFKMVT